MVSNDLGWLNFTVWELILLVISLQSFLLGGYLYATSKNLLDSKRPFAFLFFVLGISFILNFSFFPISSKEYIYAITFIMVLSMDLATHHLLSKYWQFEGKRTGNGKKPNWKYETSRLPDGFALELKVQLKSIMDREKPFLDPDLHLDDLARMLNISRHLTSQLINEYFDHNFHEFINQYRIEEAKTLLQSDKDYSVGQIALKSGFNNRISFYRAFKKREGRAPTEFKTNPVPRPSPSLDREPV